MGRAEMVPYTAGRSRVLPLSWLLFGSFALVLCLGIAVVEGRTIPFAGREWEVRTEYGNPGPNHWSDDVQSVWVDSQGLHLKVRNINGTWHCAEVRTSLPTKYGMHRFYVASRIDQLDLNVVASPFLYANDNQEIDIEFSRWNNSSPLANNAQYVVQPPPYTPDSLHPFHFNLNGDYSTHCIDWQVSQICFRSSHGHYAEPPSSNYVIQEWTYSGSNNPPENADLHIHVNLWLIGGTPPSDNTEVEFIIKDIDLLPSAPRNLRIVP